jgi:phosphatidylglycerol:prolipoprotein diacylglycerol transferase
MLFALPFPTIDPIAIPITESFGIRWYALAYLVGLGLGYWLMRRMARQVAMKVELVDDFFVWATLGVILGGRLGYALFYKFGDYLSAPLQIFKVWEGGMSFHGGLLGVVIAIILFARKHRIPIFRLGDMVATAVPIGLFFGRIANFINGELWGRPAPDLPWAFVFPRGGPIPRHPSQLYEAALEGLVLFIVMYGLWNVRSVRERPGVLCGVFLVGYGLARFIVEFFREPDAHLGFLFAGATMGQLLSLPMIIVGLTIIAWGYGRRAPGATCGGTGTRATSRQRH